MRKRTSRPTRKDEVQRIALQRTLAYLAVLRPGVPIPLAFIENLVSGDLMLEGPHQSVLQNLAAAPAIINTGLDELYLLTIQDSGRASITVTEAQRAALQQLLQALGPDRLLVAARGLGDPEMCCVFELHIAAGLDPDDYAPNQRALLAAHGLFWLERALPNQTAVEPIARCKSTTPSGCCTERKLSRFLNSPRCCRRWLDIACGMAERGATQARSSTLLRLPRG